MKHNTKKGFTLVELLVVIAILAILATVSVVGYTSFIESTNVAVDENLAGQLNNFLAAYKVNNTEEITADNIREVTAEIMVLGGLEELVPKALKNGYNFYYDLEEGKYVVMEDKKVQNSGMRYFINIFADDASEYEVKLENSFTQGNRYFLVGTATPESALLQLVDGVYNFDPTKAADLLSLATKTGIQEVIDFMNSAVIVTKDCNYRLGSNPTHVIFVEGVTAVGTTTKQWNGNAWIEADVDVLVEMNNGFFTVPNSVQYLAKDSLNATGTTIVFKKSASEVAKMAFECFTDAPVKTKDGNYTVKDNGTGENADEAVITNGTVEYVLEYYNPAESFGVKVEDVEDKVLNHTNYAYVVFDQGSFNLDALNFVGADPTLPSSTMNRVVVWTLTECANEYVAGVSPEGVVTFTDKVPTTACDITFVGTTPEGVEATFIVKVVAANGLTFSFDGVDMTTRDSISLFYGKNEGSNETFSLTNVVVKYNYPENEIEGLDLADDVVFAGHESLFNANGHTLSVKSNDSNGRLAIGVKVGEYYTKTINVDLMNINALNFLEKNTNTPYVDNDRVLYVGDDNAVLLGDLFNKNQEYPAGTQVWVMNDMPEADYSLMTGVTLSRMVANAKIDLASNWNETEIQFTSNGDVAIIVVVTPDTEGNYYRISEPVRVNVVDAKNIRDWAELAGTEAATAASSTTNVVFLADIVMPAAATPAARFTISNATLYGNCFKFDIKNGVKQNYFGIITLSNATMQDLRVIGDLYPTVAIQAPDMYGTNAVHATGTSTIDNCYIANCRANVASGNEDNNAADVITIKNSVLYGGRYSNIDLRGGTLKFEGKVVAVNQPHTDNANADSVAIADRIAGFGIAVWLEAPAGTNIQNIDKLVQYNFVPETYNDVPSVGLSASGLTINADLNDLFESIFTDEVGVGECTNTGRYHRHGSGCTYDSYELKYKDYHFERDGVKYINPGILGEDVGEGASKLVSYIGKTLPSGDRTGYNGTAPSGYQYVSMKVETDFKIVIFTLSVEIHTYGVLNTNTELFEASKNAEYIYSPWTQTAGGTEYVEYGFTNGVIIPQ